MSTATIAQIADALRKLPADKLEVVYDFISYLLTKREEGQVLREQAADIYHSYAAVDDDRIKELLKQALLELFQERRDVFVDLFAEAIEDFALVNAIREGESTELVSQAEVLQVLDGAD